MKISSLPAVQYMKAYVWVIVAVGLIGAFSLTAVTAYKFGKQNGVNEVTVVLEQERREYTQGALTASQGALTRSEQAAQKAREQAAADLALALAASEERQVLQVAAAVRQAHLEASTRAPGSAYVDPRCVLDPDTYSQLNGALK